VSEIFKSVYPKSVKYYFTTSESAELVKIATNAYLCLKVSFCNEIKYFCDKNGIKYNDFRKVWLSDPRIGQSHTQVTEAGGFSGSCFPKDLNALITSMNKVKLNPILQKATWEANRKFRSEFGNRKYKR
jgi:UDPglucose 6-dehydrogenase